MVMKNGGPAHARPDVDWRVTAAALVDRIGEPAALLDLDARMRLVNGAMEALLGRTRLELGGRRFVDEVVPSAEAAAVAARLHAAIADKTARFDCAARLADGARATLGIEVALVGEDASSALLLTVHEVRRELHALTEPVRHFEYEIATGAHDFGRLLPPGGDDDSGAPEAHERRFCYEELYQRSRPCAGCPALPADDDTRRTAVIAPDRHERSFTIVTAGPVGNGARRMLAYVLSPSIANELTRARVEALAESAALSPREREVLDLLLLGRGYDEITRVLGISQRTVKFHQAKLLEKLGAETRLDLFRVLF